MAGLLPASEVFARYRDRLQIVRLGLRRNDDEISGLHGDEGRICGARRRIDLPETCNRVLLEGNFRISPPEARPEYPRAVTAEAVQQSSVSEPTR
jgi:hypothetical protein